MKKIQIPVLQWEGCLLSQFLEFLELRGRLLDTSTEAFLGCGGLLTKEIALRERNSSRHQDTCVYR